MKGILLVDQGTEEIKFSNIHFFFMKFEDLRCTHFFHLFSYIMLSSMLISAEHKVPVTRKISIWPDQKSLPIVHLVEHLVRAWFVARTLTKSSFLLHAWESCLLHLSDHSNGHSLFDLLINPIWLTHSSFGEGGWAKPLWTKRRPSYLL